MRSILFLSPTAFLLCVSLSSADLREPRKFDADQAITPMTARSYLGEFKANELAHAQVSGLGASCVGVYVFDADGNCVGLDDISRPQYCDELAVRWIADAAGRYSVEVRNAGLDVNRYSMAIR